MSAPAPELPPLSAGTAPVLTSLTNAVSAAKMSVWCCCTTSVAMLAAPWAGSIPLLYAPKCRRRLSRKPTVNWGCPFRPRMIWFIALL